MVNVWKLNDKTVKFVGDFEGVINVWSVMDIVKGLEEEKRTNKKVDYSIKFITLGYVLEYEDGTFKYKVETETETEDDIERLFKNYKEEN